MLEKLWRKRSLKKRSANRAKEEKEKIADERFERIALSLFDSGLNLSHNIRRQSGHSMSLGVSHSLSHQFLFSLRLQLSTTTGHGALQFETHNKRRYTPRTRPRRYNRSEQRRMNHANIINRTTVVRRQKVCVRTSRPTHMKTSST